MNDASNAQRERVRGFLLARNKHHVLLQEVTHPKTGEGLLDAPGGGIRPNESPLEAMERTFAEQVKREASGWRQFATVQEGGVVTHYFVAFGDPHNVWGRRKGAVMRSVPTGALQVSNALPSIKWLVPLAMDPWAATVTATYPWPQPELGA